MPSAVLTLSRWTRSGSCSWHSRPQPNVTNTFLYLGTTQPEGGGAVELERGNDSHTQHLDFIRSCWEKNQKRKFSLCLSSLFGESWTRRGCLTADPAGNRWWRQASDTMERETEKTFGWEIRHTDWKFLDHVNCLMVCHSFLYFCLLICTYCTAAPYVKAPRLKTSSFTCTPNPSAF